MMTELDVDKAIAFCEEFHESYACAWDRIDWIGPSIVDANVYLRIARRSWRNNGENLVGIQVITPALLHLGVGYLQEHFENIYAERENEHLVDGGRDGFPEIEIDWETGEVIEDVV